MKSKILTKSKPRFCISVILFFSLIMLSGQQSAERKLDKEMMQTYAEQQAFDYMNYTVKPPSIWERVSWWFQSLLYELFSNPNTPWLTRIVYYLIILIVLGAAVFYIIRLRYGGGLTTDYQHRPSAVSGIEQTSEENFDELINGAVREQNFKLAIRYVYLKSLSGLAKRGLISLKDWKSPYDYENELKEELADPYREIARLFEYVWYGDFEADEDEFNRGSDLSVKLESLT